MLWSLGIMAFFVVVAVMLGTLAYGALSAAPWVPLGKRDTERLLHLAQLKPGELVYDLGCGDGRILVMAAKKYRVRGVGFEIALLPYLAARIRVLVSGTTNLVTIRFHDFWLESFLPADVVVCFLTPHALKRLEQKVPSELKVGARFVTYAFKLKSMPPAFVSKPYSNATPIYLYTKSVQS
jgi:SAM-dependent methyltransferase